VYVAGASDGLSAGVTNLDYAILRYTPAPEIRFQSVDFLTNPGIRLSITVPTNVSFVLEGSSELVNWQLLTNFPSLPVTSFQFTDNLDPLIPGRFYRSVWKP